MATILPKGVTQFFDGNGNPLAGGSVTFYIPNTTVPKDTWQDPGQTILNTNPVILDSPAGEAVIYGSGAYRQIVKDANGNLMWDQLTADTAVGGLLFGATSTGTPNAQLITVSGFTEQDGQQVTFIAGLTNTGPMTVSLSGGSPIAVLRDTPSGPLPMQGGEVVTGNSYTLIYDATRGAFHTVAIPFPTVPTGKVDYFLLSTAPAGWVIMNGNTIGSALSGATLRANSDTFALFSAMWNLAAAVSPIQTSSGAGSTRGVSAAVDFGSDKRIVVPDARGIFSRNWDAGRGVDVGRVLGSEQVEMIGPHTHVAQNSGDHNHAYTGYDAGGSSAGGNIQTSSGALGFNGTGSIQNSGIHTHTINNNTGTENRPRNIALLACIKL